MHFTLPFSLLLLTTHCASAAQTDPSNIALIRNTLNLYADLVSFDNYANLTDVFTPDASYNFASTPANKTPLSILGLPNIEAFIAKILGKFTTREYDADQVVGLGPLDDSADAFSQAQTVFFGQDGNGTLSSKICTVYSEYQDKLLLQQDGAWLISNRTVFITVCSPPKEPFLPGLCLWKCVEGKLQG